MNKVLIIAEAGVNHNGNFDIAKKMIEVAYHAGADIVKFQTAVPELVISSTAPKAEYQKLNTGSEQTQLEMAKKIHLPIDSYKELKIYADKIGIEFLSTPFDLVSVDVLNKLDLKYFKIPSGEITNLPYLKKIGKLNKQIILSSGMSRLGEIEEALDILVEAGTNRDKITVLHCNTEYPTPFEDVNLKAMQTIAEAFKVKVGYSDHTEGIEISIAAAALGAEVIEKHFTLDKTLPGPDHKASLNPKELENMVKAIRNIEAAMGNGIKLPSKSEVKNLIIARKSIHTATNLKKGHILRESDITMKRPGDGISPMLIQQVIGKTIIMDLDVDTKISWVYLK